MKVITVMLKIMMDFSLKNLIIFITKEVMLTVMTRMNMIIELTLVVRV